jgi:hypothetical protein
MDARHRKHQEVCKQRIAMHALQRKRKLMKNPYQIKIDQTDGLYLPTNGMTAPESAALQRFFSQVDSEVVVMVTCFFANGEADPRSLSARSH